MNGRYWMARGWMDHPMFRGERYTKAQAWCWLIENAVWKRHRISLGGKELFLRRGQLSYSTRYMAEAWVWNESKVRRFLRLLKKWSNIDAVTDAGQTVITICNYDKYQAPETPIDAPSDAGATQIRRRIIKEEEGMVDPVGAAFEKFWDTYPSRSPASNPKKLALDAFRRKVEAGIPAGDILRGVEQFAAAVKQQQRQDGERYNPRGAVCQAVTFLNQERYNDYGKPAEKPLTDEQRAVLARHHDDGQADNVVPLHTGAPGER